MNKKERPPTKKVGFYMTSELIEDFHQFAFEQPSNEIAAAVLAWMASAGMPEEDRNAIRTLAIWYPKHRADAVKKAAKILRDGALKMRMPNSKSP